MPDGGAGEGRPGLSARLREYPPDPPGWVRDLLTLAAASSACLAVPALLSGPVHQKSRAIYRLMWLNLVGHDFRLPLDTPKPLLAARAGLTGETAYWVIAVLAFALLAVVFRRLADRLFGLGAAGLAAFALVALGNGYVLPGPFLIGYWPLTYWTLLALAGWCLLEGRRGAAFAVVGLSGLLRPESWALAAVLLGWTAWREPDRLRPRHALAVAVPPLAWSAFDLLLAGDPLYSFHTLQRYQAYLGLEGVGAGAYWPKVVGDATADFHGGLLAAGLGGLLAAPWLTSSVDERRAHVWFLAVAAVPALGYWAVSAVTDVIVHVRFLSPALVVLYLYAAGAPLLVARRIAAGGDGDQGTGPGAATPSPAVPGLGAAWLGAALWLGVSGAGAWEDARRVAASRVADHRARTEAAGWLREHWVDGGGALLAGRSVDWFALELGETASRRMHQFRAVGHDVWRLPALAPGAAVYIEGDVAGEGAVFHALARDLPVVRRGVLFLPFRPLGDPRGGGRLGMIHRFSIPPPGPARGSLRGRPSR